MKRAEEKLKKKRKSAVKSAGDTEMPSKKRYSILTFVLLICIAELSVSAAGNINKNLHFISKIKGLENKLDEEKARNEELQAQIKNFDSKTILESITRNSLKMAGQNEILVIIHKPRDYADEQINTAERAAEN